MDFHLKLILIYLNEYEDQYELQEIKKLCNFTTSQLKGRLNLIEEMGYIDYDNTLLRLSELGRNYLKEKNLNNVAIDDLYESTVTLDFNKDIISFDDIYIPRNF